MWHSCQLCSGKGVHGWIPNWQWLLGAIEGTFLERFIAGDCDACGGDGHAKPTGWPDEDAARRFRPKSPPPPPYGCPTTRNVLKAQQVAEHIRITNAD